MTAALARPRASPWEQIVYDVPVPDDFVVPEHHWPTLEAAPLERDVRVRVNHLALRFSCEMFVHFERYVIDYLREYRHRFEGMVTDAQLSRFIDEEEAHVDAFYRLLALLRPELHSGKRLRFLSWSLWDRLMLWFSPPVTFFTIAAMFEEMTLFVPEVMDERPEHAFAPVLAVMHQHARDERGHVAIDEKVLLRAREGLPRWRFALQMLWALPFMGYVDQRLAAAWRGMMREFARAEGLNAEQTRALLRRKPSKSDLLGIRSFIKRQRELALPGGRTLCAILEKLLR